MNILRLAATSDTHGGLALSENSECQLAKLATALRGAAQEYPTINLDNGDTFYGGLLADHVAELPPEDNPIGKCFRRMSYAAINVGNEDLVPGLEWYRQLAAAHSLPVLSSNLRTAESAPLPSQRIVSIRVSPFGMVQVGIVGVVPDCVPRNRDELRALDLLQTVARETARLRENGCDLVVVLAHTGLAGGRGFPAGEACALAIASIEGVDAVVAGHLHERQATQSLRGIPVIAPGSHGRHLGLIDLILANRRGRIVVSGHRIALHDVRCEAPDKTIARVLAPHLRSLKRRAGRVIGELEQEISSDFAPFRRPSFIRWAERGIHAFAREAVGQEERTIVATTCAGGRGDLFWQTIHRGPLTESRLRALYPYHNQLLLAVVTGETLKQWLEESTTLFRVVNPKETNWQPILDDTVPLFDHDFFSELDYEVDLTRAVGRRIRKLCFRGVAVARAEKYQVVLNSYRYSRLSARAPGACAVRSLAPCFRTVLALWATRPNLPTVFAGERKFSPLGASVRLFFRAAQAARTPLPPEFRMLNSETAGASYRFIPESASTTMGE